MGGTNINSYSANSMFQSLGLDINLPQKNKIAYAIIEARLWDYS
ncbi:MAG: hypothetical protein NVS1B10_07210 [Candidatus Saccharimonadales bacterium]